jgi:hypothetical protein
MVRLIITMPRETATEAIVQEVMAHAKSWLEGESGILMVSEGITVELVEKARVEEVGEIYVLAHADVKGVAKGDVKKKEAPEITQAEWRES